MASANRGLALHQNFRLVVSRGQTATYAHLKSASSSPKSVPKVLAPAAQYLPLSLFLSLASAVLFQQPTTVYWWNLGVILGAHVQFSPLHFSRLKQRFYAFSSETLDTCAQTIQYLFRCLPQSLFFRRRSSHVQSPPHQLPLLPPSRAASGVESRFDVLALAAASAARDGGPVCLCPLCRRPSR